MKNKFLATVFLTSFGICSLNAESIGMFEAYSMALNNSHEAKSLDYQLQADEELVSQAYSQILPQVTTHYIVQYKPPVVYLKQLTTISICNTYKKLHTSCITSSTSKI